MNKFQKDLEQGKKYEKLALDYLEYDKVKHIEGKFKEYDFIITKNNINYNIEVKSDRLASKTNNLVIEYECNNKPSGITATTADFWIYFIVFKDKNECYKIPTKELKEIVKNCKSVVGGDNNLAKMYLLNKKECSKYLINPKNKNIVDIIEEIEDMTEEVKPNNTKLSFTQKLLNEFKNKTYTKEEIVDIVMNFSKQEYENKKKNIDEMPFGKYKFKKVSEVAVFDNNYLKWLYKQEMMTKYEDLKNEIKKYI